MTTTRIDCYTPSSTGDEIKRDVIFTAVEIITLNYIINILEGAMGTCDQTLNFFSSKLENRANQII